MTQREFLIQVDILLDKLWNPTDMERNQIVSHIQWAIKHRCCKRYAKADAAIDAAWRLVKAKLEKVREAGF